ncbi:hypothetical protein CDAR_204281 [Caerostris darwini]|uniref:Secreted protein n=1 Tax=Caerostris darwini TaxID=1538125 RepID=A0AAV4P9R6_9ARAC|nr:hypothetical protein CDAR_204281 [Caerostris darwini]
MFLAVLSIPAAFIAAQETSPWGRAEKFTDKPLSSKIFGPKKLCLRIVLFRAPRSLSTSCGGLAAMRGSLFWLCSQAE